MNRRINLHIGSIDFALTVDDSQEHLYREAQRVVNQTFDKCRSAYPNRTVDEIWALVALRIALNYRQIVEHAEINPVLEKIAEINQKISDVLTNREEPTSLN